MSDETKTQKITIELTTKEDGCSGMIVKRSENVTHWEAVGILQGAIIDLHTEHLRERVNEVENTLEEINPKLT